MDSLQVRCFGAILRNDMEALQTVLSQQPSDVALRNSLVFAIVRERASMVQAFLNHDRRLVHTVQGLDNQNIPVRTLVGHVLQNGREAHILHLLLGLGAPVRREDVDHEYDRFGLTPQVLALEDAWVKQAGMAVGMALHPRLGAESTMNMLPAELMSGLIPSHYHQMYNEIHQQAIIWIESEGMTVKEPAMYRLCLGPISRQSRIMYRLDYFMESHEMFAYIRANYPATWGWGYPQIFNYIRNSLRPVFEADMPWTQAQATATASLLRLPIYS